MSKVDAPKLSLVDMMGKKSAPPSPTKTAPKSKKAEPSAAQKTIARHFGLRDGVLEGGSLYWVDEKLVDDNPFQPRSSMDEFKLDELYDDLNTNGQSVPGLARQYSEEEIKKNPKLEGRYQLAYMHRRRECVRRGANAGPPGPGREKYAGKILLRVRDLTPEQMLSEAIRENESRDDVSTLDRARSYVKLRDLTTLALIQSGEIEPFIGKIKSGDEKEYLQHEGQTYRKATWRVVGERHKGNYRDMHRVAAILDLPAEWLKNFTPDPKNPLAFVLNSIHGRVLNSLKKWPDLQLTVYRDILREKLSGAEAERRATDVRNARPTQLDLDIKEAAKKQAQEQGQKSREETAEKNRQALAQGASHLSAVGGSTGDGGEATASRSVTVGADTNAAPDEDNEAGSDAYIYDAWNRAEDMFYQLNDILSNIKGRGDKKIAEEGFQRVAQQKAAFDKVWSDLTSEAKKSGQKR